MPPARRTWNSGGRGVPTVASGVNMSPASGKFAKVFGNCAGGVMRFGWMRQSIPAEHDGHFVAAVTQGAGSDDLAQVGCAADLELAGLPDGQRLAQQE